MSIRVLVSASVFAVFLSSSGAAWAEKEAQISGGVCSFSEFATGGLLMLYRCKNTRGVIATDLHLEISYLGDDGKPIARLTKGRDFPPPDGTFPVKDGDLYTPNGAIGATIWKNGELMNGGVADPEWKNVRVTGHWTPTAIPEPETYAMLLVGLGVLGVIRRRRTRLG